MAGPGPITPLNEGTSNQNTIKSIIKGHVSVLKELLKEPSNRDLIKPMLLDFDDIQDVSDEEIEVGTKGKAEGGNEDLIKPFKEVLKCPFTRRIIEFSSPGHRITANAKIYDRTECSNRPSMAKQGHGSTNYRRAALIIGQPPKEILKQIWDAQGLRPGPNINFKDRLEGK
ncbi:hypothetical protein Tco_1153447 [Tanacetum coccineum]